MESIVAGVPIVALPFIADQPALAAHCEHHSLHILVPCSLKCLVDVQIQRIGVQLYQLSSGLDGFTLGNGVEVHSTDENMRHELAKTWARMRGSDGAEFRRNTERVRDDMRRSVQGGEARANMLDLSKYFT
jgi:hypothetical protein